MAAFDCKMSCAHATRSAMIAIAVPTWPRAVIRVPMARGAIREQRSACIRPVGLENCPDNSRTCAPVLGIWNINKRAARLKSRPQLTSAGR